MRTVQTIYVAENTISCAIDSGVAGFSGLISTIKHSLQIHVKHHHVVLIENSCQNEKFQHVTINSINTLIYLCSSRLINLHLL